MSELKEKLEAVIREKSAVDKANEELQTRVRALHYFTFSLIESTAVLPLQIPKCAPYIRIGI